MKRKPLIDKDGEVRELTLEDMREFQSASKVIPQVVEAYRRSRGRPAGRTKEVVNLSLDRDLVTVLRRSGPRWQTRANAMLRKAMNMPPPAVEKPNHAHR